MAPAAGAPKGKQHTRSSDSFPAEEFPHVSTDVVDLVGRHMRADWQTENFTRERLREGKITAFPPCRGVRRREMRWGGVVNLRTDTVRSEMLLEGIAPLRADHEQMPYRFCPRR